MSKKSKGKEAESTGDVTLRWSSDEEALLVECYVAVSEDRNVGRSQAKDTCHHLKKSGENEVDLMGRARVMYQDESKNSPFNHDKAWAILRQHAKWDAPGVAPVDLTEDETGDFHATVNIDELFGADPRPRPPGKQRPGKKPNPTHRRAPGEVNRPNSVSLSLTSFRSNGRPPKRRLRRRKTMTRRLKVWRSCDFSPLARRIYQRTTHFGSNGKRLKSKPSYAPKCQWNRTTKTTPTSSFF
nr:hypothetical protein [Tanacetum cinerariifolium]